MFATLHAMFSRLTRIHPGLILAALAIFGFVVSMYLTVVELAGDVPVCGPLQGCEEVAGSEYAWIGPIPVAIFGALFSIALGAIALAWWKTGDRRLLAIIYGLSLAAVVFEGYLLFLQIFVIEAICVWCVAYGISLALGFVIALIAWLRRDRVPAGAGW